MNRQKWSVGVAGSLLLIGCWPGLARGGQRAIDVQRSVMKVYAFKSGLFSAFAHNHEILAPIAAGSVDVENLSVELRMETSRMQVLDPKVSDKDRATIQATMLGPEVLDASPYPEIRFRSSTVEPKDESHWTVQGTLELHGRIRPVAFDVQMRDGMFRGSAKLKQSEFGIKPISLFGGTVKVKDEIRVDFEIALSP